MPIGAIIGGVGSLVSAGTSLFGGNDVAGANTKAADLQYAEYKDVSTKLDPFRNLGFGGYGTLANYFGIQDDGAGGTKLDPTASYLQPISSVVGAPPSPNDQSLRDSFHASPGYQYMVDQGTDAVQNSAAGKTGAISGNAMTAIGKQTAGYADTDWWNYYNSLVSNYSNRYTDVANNRKEVISGLSYLGGSGQNAAAQLGGFGSAAATNVGNYGISGAGAKAAGWGGAASSLGSAATSFGGAGSSLYGAYQNSSLGPMPASDATWNSSYGGGWDAGGGAY